MIFDPLEGDTALMRVCNLLEIDLKYPEPILRSTVQRDDEVARVDALDKGDHCQTA